MERCVGRILGLAALVLALGVSSAIAGLGVSVSRTVVSPNGKYVLVLLTPDEERSWREEYDPKDSSWPKDEIRRHHESIKNQEAVEAKYSQSGLYRNDGSTDLIWPIEYLPTCKDIHVSDDGVHVVSAFLNWDWESISERGSAVDFFAQGQRFASYYESQLLTAYVPRLVLHGLMNIPEPTCTNATFNEGAQTFDIETNWGDSFRFDVTTGKLIGSTLAWSIEAVYLLVVAAVTLGSWWFWRRFRRTNAKTDDTVADL